MTICPDAVTRYDEVFLTAIHCYPPWHDLKSQGLAASKLLDSLEVAYELVDNC